MGSVEVIMEVEVLPRKKAQIQERKYHVDLSNDPEIKAITAKPAVAPNQVPALRDEDMHTLLQRYATDTRMDLYTLAEAMQIDDSSLYKLLHSEKYKDFYDACRAKRGQKIAREGYDAACKPYDMAIQGEEIPMSLVAAAKLKSNYSFMYAQSLDPELRPGKETNSGSGNPTVVVVKTDVQLNV